MLRRNKVLTITGTGPNFQLRYKLACNDGYGQP